MLKKACAPICALMKPVLKVCDARTGATKYLNQTEQINRWTTTHCVMPLLAFDRTLRGQIKSNIVLCKWVRVMCLKGYKRELHFPSVHMTVQTTMVALTVLSCLLKRQCRRGRKFTNGNAWEQTLLHNSYSYSLLSFQHRHLKEDFAK